MKMNLRRHSEIASSKIAVFSSIFTTKQFICSFTTLIKICFIFSNRSSIKMMTQFLNDT